MRAITRGLAATTRFPSGTSLDYYDDDRRDRRRYDDDRRDRRLSERYDNRDCHETRDGRIKCYDE